MRTKPEHKAVLICVQAQASDEPENDSPGSGENEPLLRGHDQSEPYTGVV